MTRINFLSQRVYKLLRKSMYSKSTNIFFDQNIMKITKPLLLAIVSLMACTLNAQELKKTVLGIENFSYSSSFSPADVENVRNQIIAALKNTGRVIVVDRSSSASNALDAESERRKSEAAMDANTVSDMVSLNANSILSVNLDQLSITKEIYEEKETVKVGDKYESRVKGRYPYIKATISYTVKITDCANGSVQAQETYTISDGSYSTYNHKAEYETAEAAHLGIMRNCVNQDKFTLMILNTFKAQGKIIQIEDGTAKAAKTVYINLGSEDGVQVKQILEVYKEIDIAGEISNKLVGEVEIVEILGASRCLAKVKKGGDVIQQVLSVSGNLPVQSRDVKEKFFGGVK